VATANSLFSSNDALFGDTGSSPTEFISVAFSSGISAMTITGDPGGGSFVMDDVTYATAASDVPEPGLFLFTLTGILILRITPRKPHVRS